MDKKDIKIAYTILACNETNTLETLLKQLNTFKRKDDCIICILDSNHNIETKNILDSYNVIYNIFPLNNNYGVQKNRLRKLAMQNNCNYDYNLDSDELSDENLLQFLPDLLEQNPDIDIFWLSRKNIVEDITEQDIINFGWKNFYDKNTGLISWPDWQARISKLVPSISWIKPVHEVLSGYKTYAYLEQFPILHIKHISRQRKQNEKYMKIINEKN